jgi:LuxR family transcriptional activator of bioluminescence operon
METRFGYASGVMASTRGFDGTIGILSAARDPALKDAIDWSTKGAVQLVATVFHQHAETLDLPRSPVALEVPPVELTEREAQCLTWASAGKSNRDIADLLNIKPRTVKKYIEGAMHKLGTGKRTQAVARALALGLIKP